MSNNSKNLHEVSSNMSDVSEQRLWKTLDNIAHRLLSIETQQNEVVRLVEKVNNQDQTLRRFGNRLDSHDQRLRETEIWQANHGDRGSIERLVTNVQDEVSKLSTEVSSVKNKQDEFTKLNDDVKTIKSNQDVRQGQFDVSKSVLKWAVGLLTALVIYLVKTGGAG